MNQKQRSLFKIFTQFLTANEALQFVFRVELLSMIFVYCYFGKLATESYEKIYDHLYEFDLRVKQLSRSNQWCFIQEFTFLFHIIFFKTKGIAFGFVTLLF